MFQTLLESRGRRARGTWGTAVSIGVHTTAIALAIVATARATAAPAEHTTEPTDIVWTAPAPTTRPLPAAPQRAVAARRWAPPRTPDIVWSRVTDVDVPEPRFPLDPTGAVPQNLFDRVGPLTPCLCGQGTADSGGMERGAYTERMVDKAAMPQPGNPAPTYPATLRAAQLEGSVTARFVVDTMGRAEPASIAFPEASHPAFAEAVRHSLLHSRYLPAIVAGHPVRQLVEQRFTFAIQR